jgi:hypothetical protein
MEPQICNLVGHKVNYTQRQKSRRVRARGLQAGVGRVPSRGAMNYDALYSVFSGADGGGLSRAAPPKKKFNWGRFTAGGGLLKCRVQNADCGVRNRRPDPGLLSLTPYGVFGICWQR